MLALDANQRITPSEVEAFLGEGGFGIVAKCRDTKTNRAVAIKVNRNQDGSTACTRMPAAVKPRRRRSCVPEFIAQPRLSLPDPYRKPDRYPACAKGFYFRS
uniref:Protein kinase domain-containing protein n=1 Tax=Maylandia zebra TaxID=106582 RepID=A0A3P9CZI1_9CICH